MFELIKNYYEKGLYNDETLKTFVASKAITAAQYEEITGKPYTK